MPGIEKEIKKNLLKSSPARAWGILFFFACIVALAFFIRNNIISVWDFNDKKIFICELSFCKNNAQNGDLILAQTPHKENVLLQLVGKSGDSVVISTVFDTITFNIPSVGDTVYLTSAQPMFWDLAMQQYKSQNPEQKIRTEISLWSENRELPFSYVGRGSISGRPVSEKEVPDLPWSELRLLELQLQNIFLSEDSIYFKRKLFVDSLEITDFILRDNLYYLSCEINSKKLCYDSRERGFFRKRDIIGVKRNSI